MKTTEIVLQLENTSQLLLPKGSVFYSKRLLNPDAEEFIIEEAASEPRGTSFHIKIVLPNNQQDELPGMKSAIHQHFRYRKNKSEKQLKQTVRIGWRALSLAILFLAILIPLIIVVSKALPESGFSFTLREILIILGWVALWRPVDYLLYEWRIYRRDAKLFEKLEECSVEFLYDS